MVEHKFCAFHERQPVGHGVIEKLIIETAENAEMIFDGLCTFVLLSKIMAGGY